VAKVLILCNPGLLKKMELSRAVGLREIQAGNVKLSLRQDDVAAAVPKPPPRRR